TPGTSARPPLVPRRAGGSTARGLWGYGGSGPADLARSILLLFVAPEEAEQMYQGFKWDVISTLPWSGGTISADRVQAWIAAQRAEEAWAERDAEPAPRRRRAEEMG